MASSTASTIHHATSFQLSLLSLGNRKGLGGSSYYTTKDVIRDKADAEYVDCDEQVNNYVEL